MNQLRTSFVRHAAIVAATLLLGVLPMRVEAINSALFSPGFGGHRNDSVREP